MFDGLLQSKFQNKTKTAIKAMKIRLETIRKKRAAVVRYLRKDIADLLKNGLVVNAYGRAEGLLVELNLTCCYNSIDQFCRCISSSRIVTMQNQSKCPEDCREAVSSLMQAAARFADLPELRDLRTLFREKYGNTIDAFVNKEFAARLKSNQHSKDSKLQLMRDIAAEFSVDWDSKAFDQKLFSQNQPKQADHNPERKPPRPSKEKDLKLYPRKVLGDDVERLTSSDAEDNVAGDKHAGKHGIVKQSSSSSSSPADDEAKQKHPSSSYGEITPPCMRSKSEARQSDGVDYVQDMRKPKSVRQRKLKPPPGREPGCDSRPREVDEEEKVMDRLLLHYSKKRLPNEINPVKGTLKLPHSRAKGQDQEEADRHAAVRASSLKLESVMPADATETPKGHCISASLPPEMLAGHVHPNLPNYSDLAARLAALRGR